MLKKISVYVLLVVGMCGLFIGCNDKQQVKVLLLPKFEIGELTGDTIGEAQLCYEEYEIGAKEYSIRGGYADNKFYLKNGIGLYVTGMGKVNAASSLMALLCDNRFDWSKTYILSIGCAGGAFDKTILGDVVLVTDVCDFDLGHNIDSREMQNTNAEITWFHDKSYDDAGYFKLNADLIDKLYNLTKDIKLNTTEDTLNSLKKYFNNDEKYLQNPIVRVGTGISGDNYWKGIYGYKIANKIASTYNCSQPYLVTEMEDVGLANVCARVGLLDRYIAIRDVVDYDVFVTTKTPEQLWSANETESIAESEESLNIFETARYNNFAVVDAIVKYLLNN